MTEWTLEEGLAVARDLEPRIAAVGWHLALAGGVLIRGTSNKNMDLVVFPHTSGKALAGDLRITLKMLGWKWKLTAEEMHLAWSKRGSEDRKHVEVWTTPDDRRVDVIYLGDFR